MNYPEFLKIGDLIGICAPSAGIVKPEKIERLNYAIEALENMGYRVIETPSVRCEESGRSASAKVRAEEFMSLLENEAVKLIIFATGGDFLCEMLDYLDFDRIKKLNPKWMQGYSDITGISYLFRGINFILSIVIKVFYKKSFFWSATISVSIVLAIILIITAIVSIILQIISKNKSNSWQKAFDSRINKLSNRLLNVNLKDFDDICADYHKYHNSLNKIEEEIKKKKEKYEICFSRLFLFV